MTALSPEPKDPMAQRTISQPTKTQLVPPLCFGCIDSDIYRGGYPKQMFASFLNHLELRTIVSITPDPLPSEFTDALSNRDNIDFVHIAGAAEQKKSKKKREVPITHEHVHEVLKLMKQAPKRPMFIHCLNGRQVTSLVVACYRITQGWSVRSTFAEYTRYCDFDRKDIAFVEEFSRSLHCDD